MGKRVIVLTKNSFTDDAVGVWIAQLRTMLAN